MVLPSGGRDAGGPDVAQVELGATEVAAEPDPSRVHEVDDRGDDLRLRGGVLGDGGHEIEQRAFGWHRRFLPGGRSVASSALHYASGGALDRCAPPTGAARAPAVSPSMSPPGRRVLRGPRVSA